MSVYLVGAGPGDPELLTVKAYRLLARAEVVVHDRLVPQEILDVASPLAELYDVGKAPGGPTTPQAEINKLLIALAADHKTVVRLKGGDPFVFGRGGEEAIALHAAGVDVHIVSGVSSAIAGPAVAGIPVTHRSISSGFTVVTAHEVDNSESSIDWKALAHLGTTLVIMMGASKSSAIARKLLDAGMGPTAPVAAVTNATTKQQDVNRFELAELFGRKVLAPSVLVIGDVAALDLSAQGEEQAGAESLVAPLLADAGSFGDSEVLQGVAEAVSIETPERVPR